MRLAQKSQIYDFQSATQPANPGKHPDVVFCFRESHSENCMTSNVTTALCSPQGGITLFHGCSGQMGMATSEISRRAGGFSLRWDCVSQASAICAYGLFWKMTSGPLAPEAKIMPLDQTAKQEKKEKQRRTLRHTAVDLVWCSPQESERQREI